MTIATLPTLGGFSQRVTARQRPPEDHEIVIDSFAGFGGWGLGEEIANGWAVDVAINHDPLAIAAHKVNHPATLHYESSVFEVDPRSVEPGRRIAHCHFSPDCTHHSKARGGAPVSDRVRGLAWIVLAWAHLRRPRVITLENVEEFQDWGPTAPHASNPELRVPDPKHRGKTFAAFIGALSTGIVLGKRNPAMKEIRKVLGDWVPVTELVRGLGYQVEFKVLRACDYGAPTIRKRFFLIARCDGEAIKWPEPTHGPEAARYVDVVNCNQQRRRTGSGGRNRERTRVAGLSENRRGVCGVDGETTYRCSISKGPRPGIFQNRRPQEPYRTAAECIDWSLPCPSIFMTAQEAKAYYEQTGIRVIRPLKPKTLERIANGIVRYVMNNARPFLIAVNHGVDHKTGRREYSIDEPMRTVCSARRGEAVIVPYVSVYHGDKSGDQKRTRSLDEPLATQDTSNRMAMCAAFLSKHRTGVVGKELSEPMPTITAGMNSKRPAGAAHTLGLSVATLIGCGGRAGQSRPRGVDEPAATITGKADTGLAAAHLMKLRGTCRDGQSIDEPMPTLTGGGTHAALIATFLQTYYGNSKSGHRLDQPIPTITTRDRVGLVTVTIDGELFVIVDIGMRMLQPHELLRAQFGEYADGWVLMGTKSQQVAGIGNSVCPHVSRAIVKANVKIKRVPLENESEAAA